jgi:hypothetical protein
MTGITISIVPAADTWSFTTGTVTGSKTVPGQPRLFMTVMTSTFCMATLSFLQRNGEIP